MFELPWALTVPLALVLHVCDITTLQPLLDKQQLGKGFICRLYMYTYPRIAFVWFSIPELVVISGHVAQASKTLVSYILVRRLKASFFTSKTPH